MESTLCAIYGARVADVGMQIPRIPPGATHLVLSVGAAAADLQVIELRQVCTEQDDYANPLEPSVQGGEKIAMAIWLALPGGVGVRARETAD
ncbi:hypothetical protein BH23GEM6_BH23GEM6_01950 [soil metagenome]